MKPSAGRTRRQFSLRAMLAAVTWTALVIAVCVGQQKAATRQREVLEQLKAAGILPVTTIGGRPLAPPQPPAPPIASPGSGG
jgi:hypothetical protein